MAIEIFSKPLSRADLVKLTVPVQALEHINMPVDVNYVELSAKDLDGKEWTFRCYLLPNGDRARPVFAAGWLRFVQAKGLQAGDKLTFSKLEDEAGGAPQYIIHATRGSVRETA